MNEVIQGLQQLNKTLKGNDEGRIQQIIQSTRASIQKSGAGLTDDKKHLLNNLDQELSVWNEKIAVILKEPVGRQGMAKHALHWVERLQK